MRAQGGGGRGGDSGTRISVRLLAPDEVEGGGDEDEDEDEEQDEEQDEEVEEEEGEVQEEAVDLGSIHGDKDEQTAAGGMQGEEAAGGMQGEEAGEQIARGLRAVVLRGGGLYVVQRSRGEGRGGGEGGGGGGGRGGHGDGCGDVGEECTAGDEGAQRRGGGAEEDAGGAAGARLDNQLGSRQQKWPDKRAPHNS